MRIASWNVNWIRAVIQKGFFDWAKDWDFDVICLQEVKAFETQIPTEIRFHFSDYDYLWHSWTRPWYAWTAIFFKKWLNIIEKSSVFQFNEFYDEWRVTQITFNYESKDVVLLNIYFPNGWFRADGTEMLTYKLDFYEKVRSYVKSLRDEWKSVMICWDFNICHTEIDIARPKENEDSIWFLPVERAEMDKLESDWLVDVFRIFYPQLMDQYTWWSYRWGARERNVWRRLDYFWVSEDLKQLMKWMKHQVNVSWSDHCPVYIEM